MATDDQTELAKTIAKTLDQSLDQIDDLNAQRLKKARAAALAQTPLVTDRKKNTRRVLSVAASVAVLLLIPFFWQQHAQQNADQDIEMALQEAAPSAQELDDLEMLMALEDTDV